jgi:hypothetical protein
MQKLGYAFAAGAVVAGGIAGSLGYLSSRDFDDAKRAGCNSDAQCQIGSPGADLANRAHDRARLAQLSAIGATALLATGVTLWVVGHSKSKHSKTVSVTVAPSSATLAWRF